MEGRQSRASSRYASGPSPPVFSGRVRRWKKQWVSSSSSAPNLGRGGAKRSEAPPLLLCRWTPLSAADDELPARRFRYTPVVPIVKGKRKSVEEEGGREINKWNNGFEKRSESDGMVEKDISNSKEEAEGVSEDQADSDKSHEHGAM